MHRWARGQSLSAVLTAAEQNGQELSAGDFVRWSRQVIDLLEQIASVSGPGRPVGKTAAQAVRAIRRGVVELGTA
jgi:ATP-dependent RNA helicase HelY